jgi:hypothetical protein
LLATLLTLAKTLANRVSNSPAAANADKSNTQSPIRVPQRAACPAGLNTPKGMFWMGKSESGATEMNDLAMPVLARLLLSAIDLIFWLIVK